MINITDAMGSKQIDINTPIIVLNKIPYSYLVPAFTQKDLEAQKKGIYYIDTDKLHNDLEKREQFISRFIPVGQIQIKLSPDHNKWFSAILANTRAVPVTTNFEEISKNVWIGVIRKGNKTSRSLGTIYSDGKPIIPIPVFPESFLKKIDFKDFDRIYSNDSVQKKIQSSGTTIDNILDGALDGLYPEGTINNEFNDSSIWAKEDGSTYSNDDVSYSAYKDLYSTKKYGKWVFADYKFNINKVNLKMIDSSGRIRNMFIPSKLLNNTSDIPDQDDDNVFSVSDDSENMQGNQSVTPKNVIDETNDLGISDAFDRKVFFSTQGSIESNDNCEPAKDNLNKMTINQCNAISLKKNKINIIGNNADDILSHNVLSPNLYSTREPEGYQIKPNGSKWFRKGKTLVLKEKDEPWFLDARIVGNVLNTTDPHKVTGELNLIGTIDLDNDIEQMPFSSTCLAPEPVIGYSRADINDKCQGKKPPVYEDFANNGTSYNNAIMYIICFIILLLLIFRRK